MSQPVLYTIIPFDATYSFTFQFAYNSSQVFKNRLIVRDNATNQSVFDEIVESRQLYHVLPANTLINNKQYNAQVSVFDSNNVESALSNTIVFYCYSNPSLTFSNLTEGQVIANNSYDFQLVYSQNQNRALNNYQVILYNSSHSQIYTTNEIYDVTNLTQTISNFDNNVDYYIEAKGVTIDSVEVTTGYVHFSVSFIIPHSFSKIIVDNDSQSAQIQITSNLLSIDGKSNPDPPTYIADERVDLTNYEKELSSSETFNDTDSNVRVSFNGATEIDVQKLKINGFFKQTGEGDLSSTNPYEIDGVNKISTNDDSDLYFRDYNIPETLYSGDSYDFATGKVSKHIGIQNLKDLDGWSMDLPTSYTNSNKIYLADIPDNTEIVELNIAGKTMQDTIPTSQNMLDPIVYHDNLSGSSTIDIANNGKIVLNGKIGLSPDIDNAIRTIFLSKAYVVDSSDSFYSEYPNPPVGGLFSNVDANGELTSGSVSCANSAIELLLNLYDISNNTKYLTRANLLGKFITGHIINGTLYGSVLKIVPSSYNYSGGSWVPSTSEIDMRLQCSCLYSLDLLYHYTNDSDYSNSATNLLKTIAVSYNNIKSRISEEMPSWMQGALYNEYFGDGSSNPSITPSWNTFNLGLIDVYAQGLQKYIEYFGNNTLTDWTGSNFAPQTMLNDLHNFANGLYTNHGLSMPCNLPYCFLHYEYSDPQVDGKVVPKPVNYDWIDTYEYSATTWVASDMICWIIKGFALLGLTTIATSYYNSLYSMNIEDEQYLLFYDRYTYDGHSLEDDKSSSTTVTGYLDDIYDIIFNIRSSQTHNTMFECIQHYQLVSENINIDGAYQWDALNPNASIGIESTAIILKSYAKYINRIKTIVSKQKFDFENTDYTLSKTVGAGSVTNNNFSIVGYNEDSIVIKDGETISGLNKYLNNIYLECDAGTVFSNYELYLQLEENDHSTDWDRFYPISQSPNYALPIYGVDYIQASNTKNLLNLKPSGAEVNGIHIVVQSDGSIFLNGTATTSFDFSLNFMNDIFTSNIPQILFEPEMPYTLSRTVSSGSKSANESLVLYDASGNRFSDNIIVSTRTYPETFTASSLYQSQKNKVGAIALHFNVNDMFTSFTFKLKLEIGGVATLWETYSDNQIKSTVQPLFSLPDGTYDSANLITGDIEQSIGNVIINGTQNIIYVTENTDYVNYCVLPNAYLTGLPSVINCVCDKLLPTSYLDLQNLNKECCSACYLNLTNRIDIVLAKNRLYNWDNNASTNEKVAFINSWLENNNINILFKLSSTKENNVGVKNIQLYGTLNLYNNGFTNNNLKYGTIPNIISFKTESNINTPELCTHFNVSKEKDLECLFYDDGYLYVNILKSVLLAHNEEAFRSWLEENNVLLYYYHNNILENQYPLQDIDYSEKDLNIHVEYGNIELTYSRLFYKSNAYVIFDTGFDIEKDFTLQMNIASLISNQNIVELSTDKYKIDINYYESSFENEENLVGYFNLKVYNRITTYNINSNYVIPSSLYGGLYSIWIRRINNIYQIKAKALSSTISDLVAQHLSINDIVNENIKVEDFEFGII